MISKSFFLIFLYFWNIFLKIKKGTNSNINKIKDVNGFIKIKLRYPIKNKKIFNAVINKFVKKIDLVFLFKR